MEDTWEFGTRGTYFYWPILDGNQPHGCVRSYRMARWLIFSSQLGDFISNPENDFIRLMGDKEIAILREFDRGSLLNELLNGCQTAQSALAVCRIA